MKDPNRFYTYAYLREDRSPYYIGKGSGKRVYNNDGRPCGKPKDKSRIIFLKQNLTEEEAFKHEIYMISVFGRKDLRTGILHNKTDGGEGASGAIISEETRKKLRQTFIGKPRSEETKIKISKSLMGKFSGENNPNYGKNFSEETRKKMSMARMGKSLSEETKLKMSEGRKGKNNSNYGKKLWNDGNGNTKYSKECPEKGWIIGKGKMSSEETRRKISAATKGKNNPMYGKRGKHNPNYGKPRSAEIRLKISEKIREQNLGKKWWNDGNGNTKYSKECPGEGWILGRVKYKSHEDT